MLVGLVPRVAAAAPQPLRAARAVGLADVGRRQIHFERRGELAREVVDAVVVHIEPRELFSILRGEVDRLVAGPEGLPQLRVSRAAPAQPAEELVEAPVQILEDQDGVKIRQDFDGL